MYRCAIFLSTLSGISSSIKTSEREALQKDRYSFLLDFYSLPLFFFLPNFFFFFRLSIQNSRSKSCVSSPGKRGGERIINRRVNVMQTNSVVLDVTTLSHCPLRPLPRFSLLGTREKCRLSKTLETRPFTRAYYAPRPSIILTFQSVLLLPPSPVLHTFVPKRCARRQAQDKSVASIFILFYFFYFYFFFSLSPRFKICETVIPLSLDIITLG